MNTIEIERSYDQFNIYDYADSYPEIIDGVGYVPVSARFEERGGVGKIIVTYREIRRDE